MSVLSRRDREKQIRRSDILKAAEYLFALKGYHKTTMRDIAKKAEYGLGTAYLYFKDKEAIYITLFQEKIDILFRIVKEKMKRVDDARRKLEIVVRETLIFSNENYDFFKIRAYEESKTPVLADVSINKSKKSPHYRYTEFLIKQAQEQGVISPGYDLKEMVELFHFILRTSILNWIERGGGQKESISAETDLILNIFLHGAAGK